MSARNVEEVQLRELVDFREVSALWDLRSAVLMLAALRREAGKKCAEWDHIEALARKAVLS
jgi:hypothetical protein